MAILGAAYQIGRSALAAYQAAVTITGQNIANVGNPDYARLSGRLGALYSGGESGGIAPGAGVDMTALQRHVDEALEGRLRLALADRSGAETTHTVLSRVEALYNELSAGDLSTQLSEMFAAFSNLQTDPVESTARHLTLASADAVIRNLQRQRTGVLGQVADLNASVEQLTRSANTMVDEIARLNELVVTTEARSAGAAGALRDRRDALLRQLGELVDVQVREQPGGSVNVYIGSETVVDFNRSRGLTTQTVLADGFERVEVRFADNGGSVLLRSGKLAATLAARDTHLAGQVRQLDQLAAGLIYEVNRAHSSGRGLVGYTSTTGTYAVSNPAAALNAPGAGLDFPIENGTFLVHVRDPQTGQETTRLIEVDLDGLGGSDTTLNSLAAALNNVPNLTATVTGDGRLRLDAAAGYEFSFSEDTSGALAALGVGTFFEGTNAATIAVHPAVQADPRLIATSLSGVPGDGANAAQIASVADRASTLLGGRSILDFHENLTGQLAIETAGAATAYEAADAVYSSLLAQREATSGVSLDEEAINLAKYERAFQGASRYLGVLDSLVTEVLALVAPG